MSIYWIFKCLCIYYGYRLFVRNGTCLLASCCSQCIFVRNSLVNIMKHNKQLLCDKCLVTDTVPEIVHVNREIFK